MMAIYCFRRSGTVLAKPYEIIVNNFLSLRLFFSVCFHTVKGTECKKHSIRASLGSRYHLNDLNGSFLLFYLLTYLRTSHCFKGVCNIFNVIWAIMCDLKIRTSKVWILSSLYFQISADLEKKWVQICSTGQRFICIEANSYKIHISICAHAYLHTPVCAES